MYNPKRLVNTVNNNTTFTILGQISWTNKWTVLAGDLLDRRQDAGFDVIDKPLWYRLDLIS